VVGKKKKEKTERRKASLFVTFEGIDGCGKSTQLELAFQYLTSQGFRVTKLREPGSTPEAEKIRRLLLDKKSKIGDITELLLYEAARAEITRQEILPLLKSGHIVLCDRFYDSTTAYQGYGRGLDLKMVRQLHRVAVGDCKPDLTLVFDLPLKTAARRVGKVRDRLESQPTAFHKRVRAGFLKIAELESRRVKVLDATKSIEQIFEQVRRLLDGRIARR
jgi:dTMP kinase